VLHQQGLIENEKKVIIQQQALFNSTMPATRGMIYPEFIENKENFLFLFVAQETL
jgi:hypothetical protein